MQKTITKQRIIKEVKKYSEFDERYMINSTNYLRKRQARSPEREKYILHTETNVNYISPQHPVLPAKILQKLKTKKNIYFILLYIYFMIVSLFVYYYT